MLTKKYLDELTYEIIGGAIEVHKIMGRGLLESVYHQCLKEELLSRKINFLTYMKLLQCPKGILINFNCSNIFKERQKIFVNEYFSNLSNQ
ncbi:GxxExxY protein [Chryseobacterium aurantiacum]|uniref:GxxExxY protein n=1 Tax=Chryseobacterium aurantiacum TaxID=2116499 RepID=UPI000D13C136|nr:GxxExxY protein [Chryseobacterium aurantiacum]